MRFRTIPIHHGNAYACIYAPTAAFQLVNNNLYKGSNNDSRSKRSATEQKKTEH